jgi:hypothetical protein
MIVNSLLLIQSPGSVTLPGLSWFSANQALIDFPSKACTNYSSLCPGEQIVTPGFGNCEPYEFYTWVVQVLP